MSRLADVTTSYTSSILSFGLGLVARIPSTEPAQPLELYEFESCPFCRKVREAFTEMDVSPLVFPCPPGGTRYRPVVREQGGKEQFPYLVDPNTKERLYESIDIVRYVANTYAGGSLPLAARGGPVNTARSALVSFPRGLLRAAPSKKPDAPLELWSFESSPYCRIAREALSKLELPYRLHNVGKNSRNRPDFVARSGKMMVPYLADPNTGKQMFESAEIARYLFATYGA
jgi:glutathione S-transferase